MAMLDDMAEEKLKELNLPTDFHTCQAFILGYNTRKRQEYTLLYGGADIKFGLDNYNLPPERFV